MKKLFIFFIFFTLITCSYQDKSNFKKFEGMALGTSFHLTFEDTDDQIIEKQIDSLFYLVNRSMSTYIQNSDISKINRGDTSVVIDDMFKEVFLKSKKIFKETNGAFDPTIGILVNAWGFGPGKKLNDLNKKSVDSLLMYVGFDKVKVKDHKIVKEHPETFLDFNANAKGYAVDIIGRFFEKKNINNYLVEIGGEIRARGLNQNKQIWKVAIEKPNFDGSRSFQTTIELMNESIATSGNYRKFKINDQTGEKFAHTMDTKTGYPSKSNLLSTSVIAKLDCADVDGYATAMMAMGFEESKAFLLKHPKLKVFLIYSDENGEMQTFSTDNLKVVN